MSSFSRSHTDVCVIGGGPAGLAAAIAARQKGFRVMVADCATPPVDKGCGEGLMPDALASLARLGVSFGAGDSYPFSGIRFIDGGRGAQARFPNGRGVGVRRTILHQRMMQTAEAAGVDLFWGARVDGITADSVSVNGATVQCRWIVGADGEMSRVRRWADLDRCKTDRRRFGFRKHYGVEPWSEFMELYWGKACQIYITPVASDAVCCAVISENPQLRLDEAIRDFPELARRLGRKEATTAERGAISSSRRLKAVYGGRIALIGDASGSVDGITGEGLCIAFQQARALADALERSDLAAYQKEHTRIGRRPAMMGSLLLAMASYEGLRRGVMSAFAARPELFSRILRIHVGGGYDLTQIEEGGANDVAADLDRAALCAHVRAGDGS